MDADARPPARLRPENGWIDRAYVDAHTLGFDALQRTVDPYTPERAAEICGVDAGAIREAARVLGTSERLLSTVLQGFYQSNQATAASCQVNSIHLLRGMLGRPGAGVLQMNGQPTAQNTRETGADGDLRGFRNWDNADHVRELAELWNVDEMTIPHWAPPTHAMQIWRYAEKGSIELLWISATNPAVTLPQLARVRDILARDELFVVVQDLFLTERGARQRRGRRGREDRHVHERRPHRAPGGAGGGPARRSASRPRHLPRLRAPDGPPRPRRGAADQVGRPGVGVRGVEGVLRRPAVRLHRAQLRAAPGSSGAASGCTPDGRFNTEPESTETFGQELGTGAAFTEEEYRAKEPRGRAFLQAADYEPSPESPGDEFPLLLTTGRTLYHFHTRTKTGRAPELNAAAPEAWVQLSETDAQELGVSEGDVVRVRSPRGAISVPARIGGVREGVVFVPFHYRDRPANELTMTSWDPVSYQPVYKIGAARVEPVSNGAARVEKEG